MSTRAEVEAEVNAFAERRDQLEGALHLAEQACAQAFVEAEKIREWATPPRKEPGKPEREEWEPSKLVARRAELTQAEAAAASTQAEVYRLTRERDQIDRDARGVRAALADILRAEVIEADQQIAAVLAEARVAREVLKQARNKLWSLLQRAHHEEARAAALRGEDKYATEWLGERRKIAASDITALNV